VQLFHKIKMDNLKNSEIANLKNLNEWKLNTAQKKCGSTVGLPLGALAIQTGHRQERKRCKEYIGWLLQQLKGGDHPYLDVEVPWLR
jgi:hypothetical protein